MLQIFGEIVDNNKWIINKIIWLNQSQCTSQLYTRITNQCTMPS